MKSKNIEYPETRIQDQSILARVFIATVNFEYRIFCNYGVNAGILIRSFQVGISFAAK
jgi:hypothetical protein